MVLYVYLTQYGFLSDEVLEPIIKPLMEALGQQFSNNESFNNVDDSVSADNNQTD